MKDADKEEKNNNDNKIDNDENSDEFLDIGNLNINQEVDIIENPKKHLVNTKKLNFLKSNTFNIDSMDDSPRKNKKTKRITYEDIYLGNDMFIAPPKSYPRDYEKNNLLLSFSNSISKKSSSNMNLINLGESKFDNKRNKHISNVLEEDDDEDEDFGILRSNTFEYFCQKGEIAHLKDFLTSLNSHRKHTYEDIIKQEDSKFVDEEEKKNKNIFYIENETELNNLNYYNKKNKCNISYLSLNLFIKKLCTENFKEKYPILYKGFLDQYQEFLPISSLIEKIISAFNYYNRQMNIEVPDLIFLLNKIISNQFKKIQDNEPLIDKLIEAYKIIEDLPWVTDALRKEIDNINFILSSSTRQDFDVEYTKYLISDRRRTKAINIRSRTKSKKTNNKTMFKHPYFYIFDFTDEEIAKNLTLISYKMMSSIDVNELWGCNFSKEDKLLKAPNVVKLIERFDKLMLFIIEDICSYETNKAKAKLITKWANVAKKCKDLHNYNDLLIINQCFNHILLKKLISTWKKISKSTLILIAELNKFCTNQQCYINIRREIVGCKHIAYIPYLGILLREIVDIEDKYKYLEKFGNYNCINCIKLQKIFYEVKKFFEFKNYTFTFTQINDLNILNQLNPRTEAEIEEMINNNEKNQSTFKEFIKTWNKKKQTKSDEMFYY
jgi:hypothetical protein